MTRILLLGGTSEARRLSHQLVDQPGLHLTCSLAGVTQVPESYGGTLRTAGFGGAAGLAAYLRDHEIAALIDATHPFATTMHGNAAQAARMTDVPLLRVDRPQWPLEPTWTEVRDLPTAIEALPPGATALLATGRFSARDLPVRRDVRLFLRALEAPEVMPESVELILGPPARSLDEESALFRQLALTHLVTKNSGGVRAKLDAAIALGLPVLMIRRPRPDSGVETVTDPHMALDWVNRMCAGA